MVHILAPTIMLLHSVMQSVRNSFCCEVVFQYCKRGIYREDTYNKLCYIKSSQESQQGKNKAFSCGGILTHPGPSRPDINLKSQA